MEDWQTSNSLYQHLWWLTIEVGGDGANGMGHFLFQGKPQHNTPNGCKLRVDQKM